MLKKILLGWVLPNVLDLAESAFKEWVDDPETDTDDNAVKKVREFIDYFVRKKLS